MTRVLIPRSDSISAKLVAASDWEKYFDDPILHDFIITGMAVTAAAGLSVDVSVGKARVLGLHTDLTAIENVGSLTDNDDNFLYILVNRDTDSEAESWSFLVNLTGGDVTDAHLIAKITTSGGSVSAVDETVQSNKNLFGFVGTGAEINALTRTYAGMKAFCTLTGNGFAAELTYRRNSTNSAWVLDTAGDPFLGNGSDGDTTISSNTDLGSDNHKQYGNLTIDAGVTLSGDSPFLVRCTGTLTLNGTIEANEIIATTGGSIGLGAGSGGAGGQSGGTIIIITNAITGTGTINGNGLVGTVGANGTAPTGKAAGATGGSGINEFSSLAIIGGEVNIANDIGGNGGLGGSVGGGGGDGGTQPSGSIRQEGLFSVVERVSNNIMMIQTGFASGAGGSGAVNNDSSSLNAGGGGGSGSSGGGALGAVGGEGGTNSGNTASGGGGGGAGGTGGTIILFVKSGNISAITINSNGANGGNGGDANGANGGAGGGGAGGNGGSISIFTDIGATDSSTKSLTAGTSGAAGSVGAAGNAGTNGNAGNTSSIELTFL